MEESKVASSKELFINEMIEYKKQGHSWQRGDCVCRQGLNMECHNCPYGFKGVNFTHHCDQMAIIDDLLKRIVELEKVIEEMGVHQETNLEHFFYEAVFNIYGRDATLLCNDREGMLKSLNFDNKSGIKWLLSPYEEPKRYQMTQFEYDLFKSYRERYYGNWKIEQLSHLRYMKENLGYFKNVPTDIRIRDILENAEVVKE